MKEMSSGSGKRVFFDKICALGHIDHCRRFLLDAYPDLEGTRLKALAIVGAASEGRRLSSLCKSLGIAVVKYCDDNPALLGTVHEGHQVVSTEELSSVGKDIPVIIASHRVLDAVNRHTAMGFRTVVPFGVLETLYPELYEPHEFYNKWIEDLLDNRMQYNRLFNLLSDETSVKTLDALLGFRLTGNPRLLEPIIDHQLYYPADIFQFANSEVYVDAGAFDGDTIRKFIEYSNNRYEKVIAFEPDPGTFGRLQDNFRHESRILPINMGLYEKKLTMYFDNQGSRHSGIQNAGGIKIDVVDLDSILAGERATYIKMNIEAAEPAALEGARNTILKWKPRLAVSCYHKPSHLWEIAFQIAAMRDDYKLYLRQHDGGVIESTVYAI
jgi:FkbM family methyltransferase